MKRPPKDAIDDPIVYFPGPIDFAAVEEFLRLINPNCLGERADHVGRLATRLLEKGQNASAADLVQLAIKIDAESRLAVNKLPDVRMLGGWSAVTATPAYASSESVWFVSMCRRTWSRRASNVWKWSAIVIPPWFGSNLNAPASHNTFFIAR